MSDQPNILYVFTDQQTISAMSHRGNPWLHTPNMDRLAAEGTSFEHSCCASPVCGPSRASMITGLTPAAHGMAYNHDPRFQDGDGKRCRTFADDVEAAGMTPYWVGKWHASEFYPTEEKRIHGFHYLPVKGADFMGLGLDLDHQVTERAVAFLKNPPDTPFFLGLSWHNPHDICYWVSEDFRDRLEPICTRGPLPDLPANFAVSTNEPGFYTRCRQREAYGAEHLYTDAWNDEDWRRYLRAYYRLVEEADRELGLILDTLDQTGQTDNTLVLFTSDHGEGVAAHHWVCKLSLYEEAIRVPMIARWPRHIRAGSVCRSHHASGLDIYPTICDAAGASPAPEAAGESLLPYGRHPERAGRDHAYAELHPDPDRHDLSARMIRTRTHKYMAFSTDDPAEALYDLIHDPGEMTNIATHPEHEAVRNEMRNRMARY